MTAFGEFKEVSWERAHAGTLVHNGVVDRVTDALIASGDPAGSLPGGSFPIWCESFPGLIHSIAWSGNMPRSFQWDAAAGVEKRRGPPLPLQQIAGQFLAAQRMEKQR